MSYELHFMSYELHFMSYELHFMSYILCVTFRGYISDKGVNCRLQDADYRWGVHDAGCRMWVAGCRCRLPKNTEALCI